VGGTRENTHLKFWVVEISADGKNWQEVDRRKNNGQLNGGNSTQTFELTGAGACRFIWLINIGTNHNGDDRLSIGAWEIFGTLIE
jgi:hypothetical protein